MSPCWCACSARWRAADTSAGEEDNAGDMVVGVTDVVDVVDGVDMSSGLEAHWLRIAQTQTAAHTAKTEPAQCLYIFAKQQQWRMKVFAF